MKFNSDISKDKFTQDFLYKKPNLFKSCLSEFNSINWSYINEVYGRANVASENFKLMNGYEVEKSEYIEPYANVGIIEHRIIKPVLYEYLRQGATLVHNRIKNEPKIDEISRYIANFSNAQTIVSGYSAFSSKSSYKSHWDTRDVFAVQLLGKKRWILKKPNFELPLYMHQTKYFPDIKEPSEIYMDVILEPGDILYIPRGWWHNPIPLDGETFHLAIGTFAPTGFEYFNWLINITPDILDFRKNLTDFKKDTELINDLNNRISEKIIDKKYYEKFMMYYLENHNINSNLSLDILGNGNINELSSDQKVFLNSNLLYFFEENFLVINGNKINLDNISIELLIFLFDNPYSSVQDLINKFNDFPPDKINSLIFKLCLENIIGLKN